MPVYTFECPKCGFEVDKVAQPQDTPPECPYCHLEMERKIASCSFILKGSGFHSTDYTRNKPKQRGMV